MDKKTLHGMWNYFLMLERDLDNTSRYIEPSGQENVYSFEFAKLLILACTEVESVFKSICHQIDDNQTASNIINYRDIIMRKYPKIIEATVCISRLGYNIEPFKEWEKEEPKSPSWWRAYNNVKHNRDSHFDDATYLNAVTALSALYVLIFYFAEITNIKFPNYTSTYIKSEYERVLPTYGPQRKLPDFET